VVWQWVTIVFNTLFYSGLFWLVSMFVTGARQAENYSTKGTLKAITVRLMLSAALALLLGGAGFFLHFEGSCWFGGGTDCGGYSPTKIVLGYLLAPPSFLLSRAPILSVLGLPLLWAYYFGLLSVARWIISDFRISKAPLAIAVVVVLAVFVLARVVFHYSASRSRTTCEAFIAGVAADFHYPDLCDKIPLRALEDGGFNGRATPLRTVCIERATDHWQPGVLIEIIDDDLAKLMRQLGYSNQALEDAHVLPADNSAWRRYLDILRDPEHMLWKKDVAPGILQRARLDFLRRVRDFECKDR
jgi:hypothetical protein